LASGTRLSYDGRTYRFELEPSLQVVDDQGGTFAVGPYAKLSRGALQIKLTPGSGTYFDARARQERPLTDRDLVAAAIATAVVGHADADAARAGKTPSAVWSHHLAVVAGDDPRLVARTYAPTETKVISGRLQHMAALKVRVE
jgi:hypothetical protein